MPTFSKEERLCSRKLIDQLYDNGEKLMVFPFSVRWMIVAPDEWAGNTPCQVMMVVPKRKHKLAVDRNRIRRMMRECYRLQKASLHGCLQRHDLKIVISVVYVHGEAAPYDMLYQKMGALLSKIESLLEHHGKIA